MYQLPRDKNVVFVVDEGIQLEVKGFAEHSMTTLSFLLLNQVGDPETGQFMPYDAAYIADQQARRRTAYEETYYIPAGKIVEFRDQNNRLVYRHVSSKPCWSLVREPFAHRRRH